ncbi:retrotransposon-related protein [Tanacetum coccineum]
MSWPIGSQKGIEQLVIMVKHNNVIPNGHFNKHWQNYVRTWFNQPARKTRRRNARQAKAVKDFSRPAGKLRPQVHGQTLKYNMKLRERRGFSLEELKDGRIGYEEFQVRMKEGTDWRKVSLGKCLFHAVCFASVLKAQVPINRKKRSSEAYIANDTLSTVHLQLTTEAGRCLKCHMLRVGGQQQMPSTSTNHADASSSLPGQQMQSGVRRTMASTSMISADVLSESSHGSQINMASGKVVKKLRTLATTSELDKTREDKGKMIITEAEVVNVADLRPTDYNKMIEVILYHKWTSKHIMQNSQCLLVLLSIYEVRYPGRRYFDGHVNIFDMVDIDLFTVVALNMMVVQLGYTGKSSEPMYYNYLIPLTSLDEGLYDLTYDEDVRCLATLVRSFKLIEVYIEHGVTVVDSYRRSPPRVRATIEDITDESGSNAAIEHISEKMLLLTWHDFSETTKEPVCDSITPRSLPQHDFSTPCKDYVYESVTPSQVIEDVIRQLSFEETELDGEAGFGDVTRSGIDSFGLSHDESFRVDDLDLNLNELMDLNVSQIETQYKQPVSEEPDGNGQEDESAPIDGQFFYDVEGIDSAYESQYDLQSSEDAGTYGDDDEDEDDEFLVDEENEIVYTRKAFRAKAKAKIKIGGDHVLQYFMLKDYVVELQSTDPNSIVKIAIERNIDPSLPTRQPLPGQVLAAVRVDSNNGIYTLAYVLVEAKIMESLMKKKQKGPILELKRRHLKNTIFCTYTPYPSMKIRRISTNSSQETRNDQFSIRRIHYNQYAVCTAVHQWCMTRSSTKELLSPLKNPERVLRSRRKLFDNPRLVELNTPEDDHLFEIKEHIEEELTE